VKFNASFALHRIFIYLICSLLSKTAENLSQDSKCSGGDPNRLTLGCKLEGLVPGPFRRVNYLTEYCSIFQINQENIVLHVLTFVISIVLSARM
jgi:hypothetical protein